MAARETATFPVAMGRGVDPVSAETVLLLHGMLSSSRSMRRLEHYLAANGFRVINWGYPSLAGSILRHADRLEVLVERLRADESVGRLHAVTHSMGGIILRATLLKTGMRDIGRVVMLAPPNTGSRLAALPLGPLTRWLPQIVELSQAADSLVNRLPEPVGLEVGVIAAERDFVVDVEATHLRCQRDHRVLPGSHQRLPRLPDTARHCLAFLLRGRFLGSPPRKHEIPVTLPDPVVTTGRLAA